MKLGIVGCGTVGGILAHWLEENTTHHILKLDPHKGFQDDFSEVEAIFISVPVPTLLDRKQDLGSLKKLVSHFSQFRRGVPIFVRSTVLPGVCDELSLEFEAEVIAMPEFLTERTAHLDFERYPIIVGDQYKYGILLEKIFPNKELIHVSNKEAELGKFTHNLFGVIKVDYFNVIREIADSIHIDYGHVLAVATQTGFIERMHTRVPGPDGRYGFGGKCFPENLSAFIGYLIRNRLPGSLTMTSIENDNLLFREKAA